MAVLAPENADQVEEAIRSALEAAAPLEIVGGGTKLALGRPVAAESRLDLSRISGIVSYEPAELVITAAAATPIAEIEAALAPHHQHLAFEPPDLSGLLGARGSATLGGVIGANLAGPRRPLAGAARDHLLGFSAVSGRGERFKSGGRVVKNVTGYDVSKLMAGSWGTLAVMTEVSVRALPRPEATVTVALGGLEAARAVEAMAMALGSPAEVSGAAWLPRRDGSLTLLRLEGPAASVDARAGSLGALLGRFGNARLLDAEEAAGLWRSIRDVEPFVADPATQVWRISVPPSAGAAVLAAVPEADGFLDWGGGLVWLSLPPVADAGAARIRAPVAPCGGHATLIRAEPEVRAAVPVFQPMAAPLADLTRRIKGGFDPGRILNPGRMYAEI